MLIFQAFLQVEPRLFHDRADIIGADLRLMRDVIRIADNLGYRVRFRGCLRDMIDLLVALGEVFFRAERRAKPVRVHGGRPLILQQNL